LRKLIYASVDQLLFGKRSAATIAPVLRRRAPDKEAAERLPLASSHSRIDSVRCGYYGGPKSAMWREVK
jgi:hypothetical protein